MTEIPIFMIFAFDRNIDVVEVFTVKAFLIKMNDSDIPVIFAVHIKCLAKGNFSL